MSLQSPFDNIPITVEELPDVASLQLHPLESNYKKVRILGWAIFALIIAGVIPTVLLVAGPEVKEWFLVIGIPFFGVLIILSFISSYYGFFQMAYALRSRDILFKKGLIFRKTTIIPFNRIQHCEVNHGPIDRMFNLSSLKVFTAGGQSSDLEIPGLTETRAQMIKDYIIGKAGLDEEE